MLRRSASESGLPECDLRQSVRENNETCLFLVKKYYLNMYSYVTKRDGKKKNDEKISLWIVIIFWIEIMEGVLIWALGRWCSRDVSPPIKPLAAG
jgi:hypothetical protein